LVNGEYVDKSDDLLDGVAGVVGDEITLPTLSGLEPEQEYRLEVAFTVNGNRLECWAPIIGEL
jgi:hypothetical protein